MEGTPKRKRLSPKKVRSPWKSKSPRRTPSKRAAPLKKSHRIEAEISSSGVRKLTQTQLNIACFKKVCSQENAVAVEDPKELKREGEEMECSPSSRRALRVSPDGGKVTPLNRERFEVGAVGLITPIDNHPDLDETRLSASAVRKVANDVVKTVLSKPELQLPSSYDRPQPKQPERLSRKEIRKALPGQECPECEKFYAMFGKPEEKRRALDICSRHRTRNNVVSYTPEGFWKPMLSQTPPQSPSSSEGSPCY